MNFIEAGAWKKFGEIFHGFGVWEEKPPSVQRKDLRKWAFQRDGEVIPLVSLRQVHGDKVIAIENESSGLEALWKENGDALISQIQGIALGVFTADCLPILLFDPVEQAIGAIHAGWRGTAKGITRKVIQEMRKRFGSPVESLQVAMGPCIGPCCYETDEPVREAFQKNGFPWQSISLPRGNGKWLLDLAKANAHLLEEAGLKPGNIQPPQGCTLCESNRFYSYRAEGDRGRQLNFIALRKKIKSS